MSGLVSDDARVNVWDEPVRGVWAHPAYSRLAGVDMMREFVEARLPAPPVGRLTGLRPTDAGLTHCTFSLPVTPWLLDAGGYLVASAAALVSDAPLSTAFSNSLPPGKTATTSELSLSYLRPADLGAARLNAQAQVIKGGRTTGLTDARITDAEGRLLAHATSRLVVLDVPVDHDTPLPEPDEPPATPDPWQREVPATAQLDWPRLREMTGREIYEGWVSGALPEAPIHHLTGLRPLSCSDDEVQWSMPSSAWLCSPTPVLYGGATAILADAALTTSVMPTLPAGVVFRPLDLRMRFLRPIFPDSGDMVATARVVHRGRSLAIAQGEVRSGDGKVAILAESSILLRPIDS